MLKTTSYHRIQPRVLVLVLRDLDLLVPALEEAVTEEPVVAALAASAYSAS